MERIPWVLVLQVLALGAGLALGQEGRVVPLHEAREIALRQHPRISIVELKAMAAQQEVIAARAAFFPQLAGNLTAVGNTVDENRIASAGLAISAAPGRVSAGLSVSQLITDFGRTRNLTESARFRAAAEQSDALTTRAQLLLQVDTGYFAALQAESVLRVAEETVKTRQLILDQVRALAANNLRSELDVSFAEVSRQEASLLLVKAQNDLSASQAVLWTLLGYADEQDFRLVEEPMPLSITAGVDELIAEALRERPELARLRCEYDAALRTAAAERALHYPTINALGTAGGSPARNEGLLADYYAAGGVTMIMPILDGCRIAARATEAEFRARQIQETLRDERDNIIRDVRIALLNLQNASERLEITAKLLEHSRRGFDLAQARYAVGTSSIVELSQAQLSYTTAEIGHTSAKYDYLTRRAAVDFQLGRTK